jgi:hypothetical protein
LEIIVLKAIEKRPQDRYATAQELADDLRRWLFDQPIRARRPTLVQRLRKWSRRHTAAVRAAGAAAVVSMVVLGWAVWDWTLRRARTDQAVLQALDETTRWQQEGKLPEALNAVRRAEGVALGGSASGQLQRQVQQRRSDLELLADLEEAWLKMAVVDQHGDYDSALSDRLCGLAFEKARINVEELPEEQAAERIRQSTVAAELAAALDCWAHIRGRRQASAARLWRLAMMVDPDERRRQEAN